MPTAPLNPAVISRAARLVATLSLVAAGPVGAQSEARSEEPIYRAFAEAFNASAPEALAGFIASHVRLGPRVTADGELSYWRALRGELGPLDLVAVGPSSFPGRNRITGTFRGRTTGAWTEITLPVGPDGKITGRSVSRGARPARAGSTTPTPLPALRDSLRGYFEAVTSAGHFSGVVHVERGGAVLLSQGYGLADREHSVPNRLDTRYPLASVTKLFTGVAILQLRDRGVLTLDDPIARFIPEYPEAIGLQVTIRHLLTHTSGIELDDDAEYRRLAAAATSVSGLLSAQLARIEHLNEGRYPDFRPLGTFDYTNEGIDLLGVIVERASGTAWPDYLTRHIFGPAGMPNTGVDARAAGPTLARGYSIRPGPETTPATAGTRRLVDPGETGPPIRPAGSGWSTAADMAAFLKALAGGTLLSARSLEEMTTLQVRDPRFAGLAHAPAYGLAMNVTEYANGLVAVGHGGSQPGGTTRVEYYPATDTRVIILSNFDNVEWWAAMRVREFLGAY